MKKCGKCKIEKDSSDFHKDIQKKDGLRFWCKDCILEYVREYQKANPERVKRQQKDSTLRRKYGISLDEYKRMCIAQDGKCAICPSKSGILNVDHDHKTGKVRKLLCNRCNRVLGILEEDEKLILSVLDYVRANSDNG